MRLLVMSSPLRRGVPAVGPVWPVDHCGRFALVCYVVFGLSSLASGEESATTVHNDAVESHQRFPGDLSNTEVVATWEFNASQDQQRKGSADPDWVLRERLTMTFGSDPTSEVDIREESFLEGRKETENLVRGDKGKFRLVDPLSDGKTSFNSLPQPFESDEPPPEFYTNFNILALRDSLHDVRVSDFSDLGIVPETVVAETEDTVTVRYRTTEFEPNYFAEYTFDKAREYAVRRLRVFMTAEDRDVRWSEWRLQYADESAIPSEGEMFTVNDGVRVDNLRFTRESVRTVETRPERFRPDHFGLSMPEFEQIAGRTTRFPYLAVLSIAAAFTIVLFYFRRSRSKGRQSV